MQKKKTLKSWQMIVSVVMLAVMLLTMFMPAIHINGKAVREVVTNIIPETMVTIFGGSSALDELEEEFDEEIKEVEEEWNIKLSSISLGTIMTKSAKQFLGEDGDFSEEVSAALESGYNKLRTAAWIIYLFAILVLVLLIVGYALQWSKYIPLAVNAAYGFIVMCLFGYLHFLTPKSIGKSNAFTEIAGFLSDFGIGDTEDFVAAVAAKVVKAFYGSAFLIGFLIALAILVFSIVCLVLENEKNIKQEVIDPQKKQLPDGRLVSAEEYELIMNRCYFVENKIRKIGEVTLEKEGAIREARSAYAALLLEDTGLIRNYNVLVRAESDLKELKRQKALEKPAMGRIACVKGVASGKVYSIPETAKVVVGTNPKYVNLLLNARYISGVHCSIRYQAANNTYIIKDHSSNGTFVNGNRLQKEVPTSVPAGTMLTLADGANVIKLG